MVRVESVTAPALALRTRTRKTSSNVPTAGDMLASTAAEEPSKAFATCAGPGHQLRILNLSLKFDSLMAPVAPDIAVAVAAVAKAQRRDAEIRSAACGRQDRTGAATGASAWILDWVGVFALIAPAHTSTA